MNCYKTIMADPPWSYGDRKGPCGTGGRGRKAATDKVVQVGVSQHYETMTLPEMKLLSMPVADDAHLYLWTTNAFMVEAHELAVAWGFIPKTILTWVKVKKTDLGCPSMKTGWYFRGATEHIIFAVRGKLRLLGPCRPTAYLLPREAHSVKPDFFFQLAQEQSPGPFLEMFARTRRDGWDAFGNEILDSISIDKVVE